MSTLTTGPRLRNKSSGLSEFFGVNAQQSNPSRQPPKQVPVTRSPPEPIQQVESSASSIKSKKSHIPFWSRRKGGGVSSPSPSKRKPTGKPPASPPPPLPKPSGPPGSHVNNGPSPPSSKAPQLPSQLPPLNVSPPTLSSKFAAHFGPSKPSAKSRDIYASIHAPSPPQSPVQPTTPSPTLPTHPNATSPPPIASTSTKTRPSVESHRSSTSTTRPTITVSISPPEEFYKEEDYNDIELFTLPRSAPTPPGSIEKKSLGTPGLNFDSFSSYFDIPSSEVASPSPPSSPKMHFPNPPLQYRILRSPSFIKDKDTTKSRPNILDSATPLRKRTYKRSMRKHSISVVKALEDALGTPVATDLEDLEDESDTSTIPTSDAGRNSGSLGDVTLKIPRRRSSRGISAILQPQQPQQQKLDSPATPSSPTRVPSTRSAASSLRSSASSSQAGPPPTTPLPSPPVTIKDSPSSSLSSLPTIPSMNSLPSRRSSALIQSRSSVSPRPRAQTISAVPAPNVNLRVIPTSVSSRSLNSNNDDSPRPSTTRPEDKTIDDSISNKENKRKPTYEELGSLLEESQNQYTTLTAYLKTVSEKLEREKAAVKEDAEMWKKQAELWRREAKARSGELKKRDLEIDGLKWLILHPMPNPADRNTEDYENDDAPDTGLSVTSGEQTGDLGSTASFDPPVKLEAARKRSMTFHDFRPSPQTFRRLKSSSNIQVASAAGSTTGLGLKFPILDVPYTKYTPGSSASSATSSTSSLAVPSLTAANTASSGLSAIPESPLPTDGLSVSVDSTPADTEKQRAEEPRSSRIPRRTSGSSLISLTSIAASHSYASNLKATRGPSIEQVLDHAPPNMDEVLERLRPFGGT